MKTGVTATPTVLSTIVEIYLVVKTITYKTKCFVSTIVEIYLVVKTETATKYRYKIYNSRNLFGRENKNRPKRKHTKSTIVEIYLVVKTNNLKRNNYESTIVEIYLVVKTIENNNLFERSTIVEIYLVVKTTNTWVYFLLIYNSRNLFGRENPPHDKTTQKTRYFNKNRSFLH